MGLNHFCPKKKLTYTLICLCGAVTIFSFYMSKKFNFTIYNSHSVRSNVKFYGDKYIHLDLKGAPPKLSYYQKLFLLLSELGATGVLIEYEDMFPYQGDNLKSVPALNSYSSEDINMILKAAKESNLSVIPLVQTFGHLEFILKLDEFVDLREIIEFPQTVCPTNNRTLNIIRDMLTQVIEKHPDIEFIHIGGDEVKNVGACNRCRNFIQTKGLSKQELFLFHIENIASFIRERYPYLKILMWDDELRSIPLQVLKKSSIPLVIEPVIWNYETDVNVALDFNFWKSYAQTFQNVWIASAFKGATGSNQYFTDVNCHVKNHKSWLSVIGKYNKKIKFQGIFITGWQRYDHFSILCELLPVSIPSLALSLAVLNGEKVSESAPPMEKVRILECEQPFGLLNVKFGSPQCLYSGGDIYEVIYRFHFLKVHFSEIIEQETVKGWMHPYNLKYEFSSPQIVQSATSTLFSIRKLLRQIKIDLVIAMQEVYDNFTISEWSETFIEPFEAEIDQVIGAREKLLSKKTWPKRPLNTVTIL